MKNLISVLIILFLAIAIKAKADIRNQTYREIIWKSDTLLISENIYVPPGTTLTINPGTTLVFTGNYGIVVNGKINAIGTSGKPIVFTVADTTGFADTTNNNGGWGRIRLLDNPVDTSCFFHCHFFTEKLMPKGLIQPMMCLKEVQFRRLIMDR